MSDRRTATQPDLLEKWIAEVNRKLGMAPARGPGSSFGLPFRMGDWEWFTENGELCVRNVITGVVECFPISLPEDVEASDVADCCTCYAACVGVDLSGDPDNSINLIYPAMDGDGPYVYTMGDGWTFTTEGLVLPQTGLWRYTFNVSYVVDALEESVDFPGTFGFIDSGIRNADGTGSTGVGRDSFWTGVAPEQGPRGQVVHNGSTLQRANAGDEIQCTSRIVALGPYVISSGFLSCELVCAGAEINHGGIG